MLKKNAKQDNTFWNYTHIWGKCKRIKGMMTNSEEWLPLREGKE